MYLNFSVYYFFFKQILNSTFGKYLTKIKIILQRIWRLTIDSTVCKEYGIIVNFLCKNLN